MDSLEFFLKKIKKWSLGTEYYRLDGSVPPEVRQKWCREFNADNNHKTKLFLISTRAGSLGLNMTAANRVIILDTSWNPAHDIQSIFRVYRFGQKKDCYIYRLVAMGTMEQKMYERSVTKQAVACRVVDELQIDRHYNMTELTELYSFDELGECVAGGVALGVRDIALLRVARDTPALHAVHEHDSLLRHTADMQLPEHERAAAWDQFQREQAHKQMQTELLEKSQFTLKRPMEIIQKSAISPETIGMQVELNDSSKKDIIHKSKEDKEAFYDPDLDNYLYPDNDPYTLKIEPEEDKKDPEYFPPDAKRRRGKRIIEPVIVTAGNSSVKSKETPTKHKEISAKSNETSVLHGNDLESNDLVKGISDIFNEHKLSAQPSEINVIAKNVSRILNQRYSIPTEQIAKKIAELFKEYHKESDDTHPKVIHNKDLMHVAETERRDSPSNEKTEIQNESNTENNKQQNHKQPLKLKIQIPKSTSQLVSMSETSCDSNKLEEPTDMELRIPKIKLRKLSSCDKETFKIDKESKPIEKINKRYERKMNNTKKVQTKVISTVSTSDTNIASASSSHPIVLSDDDELSSINISKNKITNLPTSPSIIPRTKIITTATTSVTTTRAEPINNTEDSQNENCESVPLHPDILKNQNFIKLVARVYEKGNPILDEDAALRAAEYSTSKAYDDVIKGTKLLTDGPLHQIAVELIGKQTMKTLWNSVGKKHTTELNKVSPVSTKFATVPESAGTESSKSTTIQPNQPIPVGIMKSGDNVLENQNYRRPFGLFSEECIIPDDEIRIMPSLSTTATTPTPTTSHANQQKPNEMLKSLLTTATSNINFGIVTESNVVNNVEKKTFILRRVDEKSVGNIIKLTPIMNKKKIRKVFKKQSLTEVNSSAPSMVNTVNPSTTIETTICLDSDEETGTLPQPPPQVPNVVESQSNIVPQPPNIQSQLNTFSQNSTNIQCQLSAVSQAPSTAHSKPSILSQNLKTMPSQPVTQITSTTQVPITNSVRPNNLMQNPNILNFSQIKHSNNPNIISPLITLVPSTTKEKSQTKQPIVLKGTQIPAQNIYVIQNAENIIDSESTKNVQQFVLQSNVLKSSSVVLPQNTNVPKLVPISDSANVNVLHVNEPSPSTRVDASFPHSPVECIEEFITPDFIIPTTNVITPIVSAPKVKSVSKTSTPVEKPNPKTTASDTLPTNLFTNKLAVNKTAKSANENSSQKHNLKESNDELNTNKNKHAIDNLGDSSIDKSTNENKYISLFKNIVRIEADVYEKDILENTKQKDQCVSQSGVFSKEADSSTRSKVSGTTPINDKPIDLKKATDTVPNTVITKPTSTKLSNTSMTLSNKKLETKKSTNPVLLPSKAKSVDVKTSNISSTKSGFTKQKVTDIVDLTDIEYGSDQQKVNTKCVLTKNQSKSKDAKQKSKPKSKTNSSLLDTVDLTDLDEVILSGNKKQSSTQKSKEKKGGKVGNSLFKKDNDAIKREAIASVLQKKASEVKQISKNTISGTSKTIIFNKDKVLVKTDPKPSTSSAEINDESTPKVLHIKKIYSSTSSDSSKRKNYTGDDLLTFRNKKQKKSQFKSLEDFSFEDFEDIIELE